MKVTAHLAQRARVGNDHQTVNPARDSPLV